MQDDLVALLTYERWANRKVLDACLGLTAEQYVAEPVPGWSSVRSTVSYIALATAFDLRSLTGDALAKLRDSPLKQIIVTDSIPVPPNKHLPNLTVLSVAKLLADAIERIHTNESISKLFE